MRLARPIREVGAPTPLTSSSSQTLLLRVSTGFNGSRQLLLRFFGGGQRTDFGGEDSQGRQVKQRTWWCWRSEGRLLHPVLSNPQSFMVLRTTDQALRPHMGISASLDWLPHSYRDLCTAVISSHSSSASNVCFQDGTLPTGKGNYTGKLLLTGSRLDGGKADAANTVACSSKATFLDSQHTPTKQSTGRRHWPS